MAATQQKIFPKLKLQEIHQVCNEVNIPITLEELKAPTPPTARMIYENFLELLTGISKESLQQPQFNAMSCLSHPELFEEAIPEIAFYRELSSLLYDTGVTDFSWKDLNSPDPLRLRIQLSALINFAKYREQSIEKYEELTNEAERIVEEKTSFEMSLQEANAQLRALRTKREIEQPHVEALEGQIAELENEIRTLNQQQAGLQTELRRVKNQIVEFADKIIVNTRQEITKLRSQIVPSPEELHKIVEELKSHLDSEREFVSGAEKKTHELQAKCDMLTRIEKDVQKSSKTIEDIAGDITRTKQAKKEAKEARSKLANIENRLVELNTSEQQLLRQLQVVNENSVRLSKQEEEKKELAESNLLEAQRQKREMESQKESTKSVLDQNSIAIQKMQQKIEQMNKEHEEEMNSMLQQYQALESQVKQYHSSLFQAMKAV